MKKCCFVVGVHGDYVDHLEASERSREELAPRLQKSRPSRLPHQVRQRKGLLLLLFYRCFCFAQLDSNYEGE